MGGIWTYAKKQLEKLGGENTPAPPSSKASGGSGTAKISERGYGQKLKMSSI